MVWGRLLAFFQGMGFGPGMAEKMLFKHFHFCWSLCDTPGAGPLHLCRGKQVNIDSREARVHFCDKQIPLFFHGFSALLQIGRHGAGIAIWLPDRLSNRFWRFLEISGACVIHVIMKAHRFSPWLRMPSVNCWHCFEKSPGWTAD